MSLSPIDTASVDERLAVVRARIVSAGGNTTLPRIIAVTKGFGVDACVSAIACGLFDIGENYAAELSAKHDALVGRGFSEPIRWHFLGAIQRRKLASLLGAVSFFHGVDRLKEGEAIARFDPAVSCLIEVNTTANPTRGGIAPPFVADLLDRLVAADCNVVGLMTIGQMGDVDATRASFRLVRGLADELGLKECSMGMSEDLEDGVEAGATMVRVGRALFGPRPT